ncbi:alpha/beta hydrolase family esterase [Ornithobacterium rhinotracheale]|uniref:Poly(3-hydroxybutyrate) depolymerase n=1 Tax=Ornithobacterium rhinotracheale (strain ATCC 51463 / DSM 15997 / CCUG 23171 / CIP 104009 / LMG 9086) TaxID=867902 RepID=I3ZZF2_ORNRL|nr:prolyl oligopeptidase family serine peptidase [Ornithobacterium rhinotracheale]AFL97086.1 poly(3-hydroxybutyrate) depolymerase [Ornithobacterium rhinotracheale DSM 15997]AIP99201.1 plasmid partitioning protein [Ornithobacterium rhinotracheale ORT-UMN 88]KGB67069.1 plasmid partitioning protein [Ornithobacterium rhinotracheale H06-030791]MBN3662290.1 prolyl oligopeptidase family serine peptidase [Ornithobacterium rhinotracheale]MCK0194395.1 prolyl oligopeptidase family serine peptidase [Ornit
MRQIISILLLVPFSLWAQLKPGNQDLEVSGRAYQVSTPSNYKASQSYPIVFELHSFGKDKTQMYNQKLIDELQYISVRPEGEKKPFVGNVWNTWKETSLGGADDVSYIQRVYDEVKKKLGNSFDSEKVYVYGFSNGGAMAMKMLEETNLFRGAIIRSMSFTKWHVIPQGASKVPMIFVHGIADETVPYQGGKGKYGVISPNFESIKETVKKWSLHDGLKQPPIEIKYLKGSSPSSDKDFYYAEYHDSQSPIYFYAIEGGKHATDKQFSNSNMRRALLRMMKAPQCFGIYRQVCE